MKTTLRSIILLGLSVVIANCSKSKNSSAAAAVNAAGTTSICTAGYYTATNGQVVPCTVGSTINTAYTSPLGYNGTSYPTGVASCQQYTQYYGIQYVPVNFGGEIDCIRYDYVSQYAVGTNYAAYGADYYYAYPPNFSTVANGGQYDSAINGYINFTFNF